MEASEYQLYRGLWKFLVTNYCVDPDLILYLRTPAQICLDRIDHRGRSEEEGIPLDYLLQLERLHDEWLLNHPKALVLDGERWWTPGEILAQVTAKLAKPLAI
jgi:deoxyadenosine/deoxycytidine kinase